MVIVSEGDKSDTGLLESLLRHVKTISVGSHHADYLTAIFTYGLYSLKAAAASGDQVFHHNHLHTWFQFSLDKVLESVVLRFASDVCEGQVQCVCHECSLCDGSCGDSRHSLCLGKMLQHGMGEFQFDECPQFSERQRLSVVTIEG